jgi:hypothetical protein
LPVDTTLLVRESFVVEPGCISERAACHFPAVDFGRAVRALIESLLL